MTNVSSAVVLKFYLGDAFLSCFPFLPFISLHSLPSSLIGGPGACPGKFLTYAHR